MAQRFASPSAPALSLALVLGASLALSSSVGHAEEPAAAAPPADAAPTGADETKRADALFEEGRVFAASGDYASACPKFEESQRIRPGIGTLFNLAECHEKVGKLALAFREYTEVAERTRVALQADREKIARERLEALASRVPLVTIAVPEAAKGMVVTLDGQPLAAEAWNTPQAMDPGEHVLRVSGGKGEPHEESFTLAEGDAPITLSVSAEDGVKMKRNTGLIVTGSILMEVGIVGLGVAGYMVQNDTNREALALGVGLGGLACVGVGVPLFVIGLKKRPVEGAAPAKSAAELDLPGTPRAFVGATTASVPAAPFDDIAPGPVPAVGIGPGSATAAWRF
jgi:hypothetical protein